MKPCADTRDGNVIKSRAMNTELFAFPCQKMIIRYKAENYIAAQEAAGRPPIKWILVDEAQFLTPGQVDQLARIVDGRQRHTDYELISDNSCFRLKFEVADKFEGDAFNMQMWKQS